MLTSKQGRKGGLARARNLRPDERASIARQAARARWLRGKLSLDVDIPKIENFCKKWNLTKVEVFGSAARGDMHPKSDVDIIISGDVSGFNIGRFIKMQSDLEQIFGRPIDLFTREGIDRWRNKRLHKRILSETEVIYVRP
jgi:predicted nucleotidyltransferase